MVITLAILEMRGVHKYYPGVHALKGIDFSLGEGEVHALVGENGAGKSTLIKILGGVVLPDEGVLEVFGEKASWKGPGDAIQAGIGIIHQELSLAPHLTVAQNIYLGREGEGRLFVDLPSLNRKASDLLGDLGVELDPAILVEKLTTGEMQLVEIAKALSQKVLILAMDEPTSSLSARETERLFHLIRDLKSRGTGIIYISHRLEEVFDIADRISVLRDGEYIGCDRKSSLTNDNVITMMVGREVKNLFPRSEVRKGKVLLEVRNLSREGVLYDLSLSLKEREILGLFGLVGSGRSELARCIYGLDPFQKGEILVEGSSMKKISPASALDRGIFLVPEDRKLQGLFLNMDIKMNISIVDILRKLQGVLIEKTREVSLAKEFIKKLGIKCTSADEEVRQLSGGNQQKVMIARALSVAPKILILDEPTRGIDVGAKAEIHRLMDQLSLQGMGIIMISSELPEVIGMSDRIMVMRDGRFASSFVRGEADSERTMAAAAGG